MSCETRLRILQRCLSRDREGILFVSNHLRAPCGPAHRFHVSSVDTDRVSRINPPPSACLISPSRRFSGRNTADFWSRQFNASVPSVQAHRSRRGRLHDDRCTEVSFNLSARASTLRMEVHPAVHVLRDVRYRRSVWRLTLPARCVARWRRTRRSQGSASSATTSAGEHSPRKWEIKCKRPSPPSPVPLLPHSPFPIPIVLAIPSSLLSNLSSLSPPRSLLAPPSCRIIGPIASRCAKFRFQVPAPPAKSITRPPFSNTFCARSAVVWI